MSFEKKPIVRFAPSPTGYLHIGGARTALFNYLFAKKNNGTFLLRVEDTDKERSTTQNMEAIFEGLQWLGLTWDGQPIIQSQRVQYHKQCIETLLQQKKAYKCFMTKEELEARKQAQLLKKQTPRYDGREEQLKNQDRNEPYVVRFLVPPGQTHIDDKVKGPVVYSNKTIEDFVLARSDGTPMYNFVAAMDDMDMGITHVIRGDDHLNNTAKQVLLFEAFGRDVPVYAHVPLILGEDKQRLSKRHGATSVQSYRDMGYLPHAMVNFLVRLGWSFKDQEIFSLQELIEHFTLEGIGKSAGVFNTSKLLWLNQHYIKEESFEVLQNEIDRFICIPTSRKNTEQSKKTIDALRDRAKTTLEMAQLSRFYYHDDVVFDEKARAEFLTQPNVLHLKKLNDALKSLSVFTHDPIKACFEDVLKQLNLKMKDLAQPLRVALVGGPISPGVFEVMEILGQERTSTRLQKL